MSESLAKKDNVATMPQHSLVKTMATRYGLEADKFLATLKGTIFPAGKVPTNEQIAAFMIVANEYDLNPFVKEIYAFPTQNGGITPVVPIDGWAATTNKNPMYDGVEFADTLGDAGNLISVTCRIYRKDRSHPTEVTEYMSECKRNTPTWSQWPARMLRHKSFIQCARLAFSLSGIYDPDEADRIATGEDVGATVADKTRERVAELKEKLQPTVEADQDFIDMESDEEAPADFVDQSILEPPIDTDEATDEISPLETLRAHVQAQLEEFPKGRQKDLIAGKTSVSKMDETELNEFSQFLREQ